MISAQSCVINIVNLNINTKRKTRTKLWAFCMKPGGSLLPLHFDAVSLRETVLRVPACLQSVHYESLMSSSKILCLLQPRSIFQGFLALFQGGEYIRTKNKYLFFGGRGALGNASLLSPQRNCVRPGVPVSLSPLPSLVCLSQCALQK